MKNFKLHLLYLLQLFLKFQSDFEELENFQLNHKQNLASLKKNNCFKI